MDLAVEFSDPSGEEPAGWDGFVAAGQVHQGWRWSVLRASAADRRRGATVAGLLRDNGRPVGLVYARLLGLRRPGSPAGPLISSADVGCPTGTLPGLVLAGGVPATLQPSLPTDTGLLAAAVGAVEGALRREFGRRIRTVSYRSVFADALPTMVGRSSMVGRGLPVAMFYNRFRDFDHYLASLSSHRRQSQRRVMQRIASDPELVTSFGPMPTAADLVAFNRLAQQTGRRNETRRWPPPRRLSDEQRSAMARAPGALAVRYDTAQGEMVGLGLSFDHPKTMLLGPYGAVDPKRGGPAGLWFDSMARVLRYVIESGREGVIGGKWHIDLKRELGYEIVPQWLVLRRVR